MNRIDRWAERLRDAIGGRETDRGEEVAEIVTRLLIDRERPYEMPALPSLVLDRLQRWAAEQDEGRATMLSEIDPDEVF